MEVVMTGQFMNSLEFISEKDKEVFDTYTKEQIYIAYLEEREARVSLNIEMNRVNRKLAEIRYTAGG